jgi:putative ATP-dependent endonuclease of OLD family
VIAQHRARCNGFPHVPDEDLVAALKVNRHAIVLMDSDRRAQADALKPRVERVGKEAEESGAFPWVTDGKEVKNYLPVEALRLALSKPDLESPGQHDDGYAHTERSPDKMALARIVLPHLSSEQLANTLDLKTRLNEVVGLIRQWNGLPAEATSA